MKSAGRGLRFRVGDHDHGRVHPAHRHIAKSWSLVRPVRRCRAGPGVGLSRLCHPSRIIGCTAVGRRHLSPDRRPAIGSRRRPNELRDDSRTLNRRSTARCDQAGVCHRTVHDARRTCATLLVGLDVYPRVIRWIRRHADESTTLEINAIARADGDARSAAQAEGSPLNAQVNSRLRCCTGRILLLYWQQERPSPTPVRAFDLREYGRGDRI